MSNILGIFLMGFLVGWLCDPGLFRLFPVFNPVKGGQARFDAQSRTVPVQLCPACLGRVGSNSFRKPPKKVCFKYTSNAPDSLPILLSGSIVLLQILANKGFRKTHLGKVTGLDDPRDDQVQQPGSKLFFVNSV
jgi:hypothetical protein